MNRLERYLMIATNVAVLVGLLLVAFEFRQNREAIEIEQQLSIAEVNSQIAITLATDAALADLVSRAWKGEFVSFSDSEHVRLRAWVNANLEPRLGYYFLRDSGFMLQDDWCNFMRQFVRWRANTYFRDVVVELISYADEVHREIDNRCPATGDA